MKNINNAAKLTHYLQKYDMTSIIGENALPYLQLFHFKRNDYITKETNPLHYLFLFVEGKAKVCTSLSNGKSSLLSFYLPLKVIGDVEFINDVNASATIECIEDSYCIGISLIHARQFLSTDPKFLTFIAKSLSHKLISLSNNSSINQLYPLETRLASYILATTLTHDSTDFVFKDNLMQVSELLGTSYRHLLRTLNSLCEKGVICKTDKNYAILDRLKLKELSADLYI